LAQYTEQIGQSRFAASACLALPFKKQTSGAPFPIAAQAQLAAQGAELNARGRAAL
jgi:hypothetical protein